jgi:hypothetical protein
MCVCDKKVPVSPFLGSLVVIAHLIVGFHARSITRAQALPVVRQMKLER